MENTATVNERDLLLNRIRTLESELDRLSNLNGEVASASQDSEVNKRVEHFHNQFLIQKGQLDRMKHNVKLNMGNPHAGLKELEEFDSYLSGLKDEFDTFSKAYL